MAHVAKTVETGVGKETAVIVRVRHPVNSILRGRNGLGADLCNERIMKVNLQVAFNGKRFVEELLVVITLHRGDHEDTTTNLILPWARRLAEHLQNIADRIVDVSVLPAFEELRAHYNHQMSSQVKLPADIARSQEDLNRTNGKQVRDDTLIGRRESLMVVTDTMRKRLSKSPLVNSFQERSQFIYISI